LYSSGLLYEGVMRILYGRQFHSKYQSVANLIPETYSVLDLCCGPALVYSYLSLENQRRYLGVDLSRKFVQAVGKKGVSVVHGDVWRDDLPKNYDCILLLSSLYQFDPVADIVLQKMLFAATELVIISEPIINLSTSRNTLLKKLASSLTSPADGSLPYSGFRYDSGTLTKALQRYREVLKVDFVLAGGRERVVAFDAKKWRTLQGVAKA
jgi:SAM-dependent methyltransferase